MDSTIAARNIEPRMPKVNNNKAIIEKSKARPKRAKVSKKVRKVDKPKGLDTIPESAVLAELKSVAEKLGLLLSDVRSDLHAPQTSCSTKGGKGGKPSRDGDSMDTSKEPGSDKNKEGATADLDEDVVVVEDGVSTWQQQADHTQDTALALTTADMFCVKAQAACEDVRSRVVQWRLVQMRASTGMYEDAHVVAALAHVQQNAALTTRYIILTMEGMCNVTVGMLDTSHMQGAWQLLIGRLSETLRILLSSCFIVSLQPDLVLRKNVKVNVTASLLNGTELGAGSVSSGVVCQIIDEEQSRVINNMTLRENSGDGAPCAACKMGSNSRAPNPTFNTASHERHYNVTPQPQNGAKKRDLRCLFASQHLKVLGAKHVLEFV